MTDLAPGSDRVDEVSRCHLEIVDELGLVFGRSVGSPDRADHVGEPGIPFGQPDDKGDMAHAKPRMPARLAVGARSAPVLAEEERQVLFRIAEVIRIHMCEDRVMADAFIEPLDQLIKEGLAAHPLVQRAHPDDGRRCGMPVRAVARSRLGASLHSSRTPRV